MGGQGFRSTHIQAYKPPLLVDLIRRIFGSFKVSLQLPWGCDLRCAGGGPDLCRKALGQEMLRAWNAQQALFCHLYLDVIPHAAECVVALVLCHVLRLSYL